MHYGAEVNKHSSYHCNGSEHFPVIENKVALIDDRLSRPSGNGLKCYKSSTILHDDL
jgi:hypothetical protein